MLGDSVSGDVYCLQVTFPRLLRLIPRHTFVIHLNIATSCIVLLIGYLAIQYHCIGVNHAELLRSQRLKLRMKSCREGSCL